MKKKKMEEKLATTMANRTRTKSLTGRKKEQKPTDKEKKEKAESIVINKRKKYTNKKIYRRKEKAI